MLESLLTNLTQSFPNHKKSCLKNILILSLSILQKETVCLNRLKGTVGQITGKPHVAVNSHYKRLIRIFDQFAFSSLWIELLSYVFQLLRLKSDYLLLDGTSWKTGKRWHHFLTLCVVYQGVAIPIYWTQLSRPGASSTKERKRLIRKAEKRFDLRGKPLIADREYVGTEWIKFLIDSKLTFVIRLKQKTYHQAISQAPGRSYQCMQQKALRSNKPGKIVSKTFWLEGNALRFVVVKNPDPDAKEALLLLISNLTGTARQIAAVYLIRWKIEHCFFHLKSNGFHLESINLSGTARCNLLMAVMVFAYTLSIHEGLKDYHRVVVKRYADGSQWKSESVFRYGYNKLLSYCTDLATFLHYLLGEIRLTTCRYNSPLSINV